MSDATLYNIGPEEEPQTSFALGHVAKAQFIAMWNAEWEGQSPTRGEVDYMYAVPPHGDQKEWQLDQDATVPGAVPVTVFMW